MNALEAIVKRTSIRSYKPEQLTEGQLDTILKAGMAAPVGSNDYASLHMTVVQNMDILNEIGDSVTEMVQKVLGRRMDKNFHAPTMIVVSAKKGHMPGIEMANAGCVLENMAIAATDLGLGSIIWGGAAAVIAQSEALKAKLNIPEGYAPTLCLSLGYAVQGEPAKPHTISVNRV